MSEVHPPRNYSEDSGTNGNKKEEDKLPSFWQKLCQEARSVSAWMAVSTLFRLTTSLLIHMLPYRTDCAKNECQSTLPEGVMTSLSILAGWMLAVFPGKVVQDAAPGFIYANEWILVKMKDRFGSFPNIPLRVAETVLGRLSWMELLMLIPVHFACFISTALALQEMLAVSIHVHAFEPIEYSDENPWIVTMVREILSTTAFCVAMLVLPEIFRVNRLPSWCSIIFLLPIYNFGVDINGKASTFAPNVVVGLAALTSKTTPLFMLFSSILGGLLGGVVMQRFFPDDHS